MKTTQIKAPKFNHSMTAETYEFKKPSTTSSADIWDTSFKSVEEIKAEFLEHIKLRLTDVTFYKASTLAEICGEDIWNGYDKQTRISLGRYIAKLVANGDLPLVALDRPNKENHKLYKLK